MSTQHPTSRLFCLVPDVAAARAVAGELAAVYGDALNLRVVAPRETLLVGLAEARLRERSGIFEAARRGLIMGSIAGTITGLVAAFELSPTFAIACGLVLFGCVGGSGFGAWASAMMGIEEPHSTIRPYQSAIDSGRVLIIVDTTLQQRPQVANSIKQRVPHASIDGTDDDTPSGPT